MDRQSVGETFFPSCPSCRDYSKFFIFRRKTKFWWKKNNYFEKGNNRTRERSNTSVLLFRKFQFIRGKISWFNVSSSTVETKDRMF